MAKITFNKIGAKINTEIKTITFNDAVIEVKQYLELEQKMLIAESIVQALINKKTSYYNPAELEILELLNIIYSYSNISFTDKQKADYSKTYDILVSSGLATAIINAIPEQELNMYKSLIEKSVENLYAYLHSASALVESFSELSEKQAVDFGQIATQMQDVPELKQLAEIMGQLG